MKDKETRLDHPENRANSPVRTDLDNTDQKPTKRMQPDGNRPFFNWQAFVEDHMPRWRGFVKQTRRFMRNPLSVTGLILIVLFAFVALFAPWLAPPDPNQAFEPYKMPRDGFAQMPRPPQAEAWDTFPPDWHKHPFGTMEGQYDIYYGIV